MRRIRIVSKIREKERITRSEEWHVSNIYVAKRGEKTKKRSQAGAMTKLQKR